MRAIGISRYGDASVLERWEVPVPQPGAGEALVKVRFAGVNYMDVHTRQGKYATSTTYRVSLPVTLGMEGSGEVESVGPGVAEFVPGDRVAWCLTWGSYAEYALVPVARLARVPDQIGLDVAAASIFQGSTAHYLVHEVARLQPGMTCLVHAASGAVGQLLLQMGTAAGARVLATTSTEDKAAVARSRGADQVFSYGGGHFADEVLEATGGRGVDVTFDPLGRPTLRASLRATRTRGLVVNYGAVAGAVDDLDPLELGEAGSLFLTRPRLADYISSREELQRRADEVFAGLASGTLEVFLSGRFALDRVAEALAELEERRQVGKAIVAMDMSASQEVEVTGSRGNVTWVPKESRRE
jgi:NADPH2:quinone reductase